MSLDQGYIERNRASSAHMRALAQLSEDELRTPLGEHWTIAIMLVHLAFWDRRLMEVLDRTQAEGKLVVPQVDISVNDLSLPLWAAIPPKEAGRIAVEIAGAIDWRLEGYPLHLLEEIYAYHPRWVERAQHREQHMSEAEEALAARRRAA